MELRNFMGIDWGNATDRMVVSVINSDGQEIHHEVFKHNSFAQFHRFLVILHSHFSPVVMLAESNSIGIVSIEALQAEGFPVRGIKLTHDMKRELMDELQRSFADRQFELIKPIRFDYASMNMDDEALAVALSQWARRRYGGGRISFT